MKRYIKYILFIGLIINLNSCTDPIDIDLPDGGSRLVVEASIDWKKGSLGKEQTIRLGESTLFFGERKNKDVLGAKVSVFNDTNGMETIFTDQNNGEYKTVDFIPKLNQSYTLRIDYKGKVYQAKETMVSMSEINKIEQEVVDFLGEEMITVKVYFDDVPNVNNYYLTEVIVFDETDLNVRDDRLTDGNENETIFGGFKDFYVLQPTEVLNAKLFGISNGYYNYMRLLIKQAKGGGGSPFSSTPSRLYGNCKNINNSEEEVIGYFRLCEYVEIDYVVQ